MKRALIAFLATTAISTVVALTPAVAQVAGNAGDLHTPTLYTSQSRAAYGYEPGYPGVFAPFGVVAAGVGALAAPIGGGRYAVAPQGGRCGATQDFNGRYTALCGP